jgi:hypothetical protein
MDTTENEVHTNALPVDDPLFKQSDVKDPSKIYVWGVSTPPASKHASHDTLHVTEEDIGDACLEMVGRPILLEHTVGDPLGRVVKARPNAQKQVEFEFEIENTPAGHALASQIRSGKYRAVSWGGRHDIRRDSKLGRRAVADKKYVELSVCENPEFEEAKILGISEPSKEHVEMREKYRAALRTPAAKEVFGSAADYIGESARGFFLGAKNLYSPPSTLFSDC